MPSLTRLLSGVLCVALGVASTAIAGSDTPPEGPPWVRSLVAAQKAALTKRVPIFVYLTKTH